MALDFDGGLSPEAAIDRMQVYEITPNAWYPTFGNSTEKPKFRLLFFLDTLITDIHARNYLMDALFEMFPEADKACKNPAHFFYGTDKQGQVLNSKALPLDLFLSVLESDKIKNGGRLRKIDPKKPGAAFLRKNGFSWASYSNTIGSPSKAIDQQKIYFYENLKRNKYNKEIDWDKLQSRIRLFFDFMKGEERLSYAQLLGLAQNLA
ncbi:hypothetical protein [Gracilimonas sediminicola]|uniref:hypothetical protein n=1 Tax=Gracilimonas sediminicola TaxID=2952158 RepID=UPI0038D44130